MVCRPPLLLGEYPQRATTISGRTMFRRSASPTVRAHSPPPPHVPPRPLISRPRPFHRFPQVDRGEGWAAHLLPVLACLHCRTTPFQVRESRGRRQACQRHGTTGRQEVSQPVEGDRGEIEVRQQGDNSKTVNSAGCGRQGKSGGKRKPPRTRGPRGSESVLR